MATNALCLNTLPLTEKEKNVELTVFSSNGSDANETLAELMNQMCAMVQLLHLVEGELALNQTKMASLNNEAAQLNVDAITAQGNQAVENAKAAAAGPAWWSTLLKVLLSVAAVLIAACTLGTTAGIIAIVIILITTVPMPFLGGQTLMGAVSSQIAQAMGEAYGWSQATIQEATGYINLAIGVVLAVLSFGAGFAGATAEVANAAATIGEDVVEGSVGIAAEGTSPAVEEGASVIEGTAEKTASTVSQSSKAMNVAKFSAVTAFTSQIANSNCIGDIMMGTLLSVNPNASAKEKEIIGGIAAALTIIVAIVGALLGGNLAVSSIGQDLEEGSTLMSKIASKLETSATALTSKVEIANGVFGAGMSGYQGTIDIEMAQLNATVTRLLGGMEGSKEISALINQTMNQINAMLKAYTDQFGALENNLKNIGQYNYAEFKAMIQANQAK